MKTKTYYETATDSVEYPSFEVAKANVIADYPGASLVGEVEQDSNPVLGVWLDSKRFGQIAQAVE